MATEYKKIILRRGTGTPPSDLAEGELAFQTDTDKLFVGTGDASPNHYKLVGSLEDEGVTASVSELNVLDGITATTAELNVVDGFTGTVGDLNYAKDLRATGVTATEFDYLDGVTSNIQTQINNSLQTQEWILVQEINIEDASTTSLNKVIDSAALGESFDNGAYDYKFVIDGFTNATETTTEPLFRFNEDTTAGKYSYVRSFTRISNTSNGATNTLTANSGGDGTSINTGLDLTTATGQGNITVLQMEVVVTRSIDSVQGYYGYHLRGEGSIIAAESTQTIGSTYSLSAISQFTGSFGGTTAANLTSFDIYNLPGAGTSDSAKIRIYKRAR